MPEIIQALEEMEWDLPKPVQAESIPLVLGGGDVMCAAETGSGKTGAFCLPVLQITWEALQEKTRSKHLTKHCALNKEDSDGALRLSGDLLQAQSRDQHEWSGARATYGIKTGKWYYEVKVIDEGLCRFGWSAGDASLQLGSDRSGFGYGGTAKKSFANVFDDYGDKFGKGDLVGCAVDREQREMIFYKNGKSLGVAFEIPSAMDNQPLYPHILLRNAQIECKFKPASPPQGYKVMDEAVHESYQEELWGQSVLRRAQKDSGGHHPTTIIVEPTFELAEQIRQELVKFTKYLTNPKVKWSMILAGRDNRDIYNELRSGVDILVGTPGKMEGLMKSGGLNLSQVRFFILDEADQLGGNFIGTIQALYNKIRSQNKERVQTCMFSATLHSQDITNLADQITHDPVWVDLKGKDFVPDTVHHAIVEVDVENDVAHRQMAQQSKGQSDGVHARDAAQYMTSELTKKAKMEMVCKVIEDFKMEYALIFCRTKIDCDHMAELLTIKGGARGFTGRVEKGKENPFSCLPLHSGLSRGARSDNLDCFKAGEVRFLVCTDVAARGIDVKELPYVINVTLPDKAEDYIHRVGRVGRADRMGLAISLVSKHKEKVWYHTCPSRGEGCNDTRLVDSGGKNGCCIV
eukprot:NODE_175_length_2567_cov_13.285941_g132_i0.p1 GENE.NODE_175_length_2567_cov_13.285941_g132_i0~~NODE_175_length_2567_cov_13.285941_g132_i0.p1  ORF type:complete len:633 (+),score=198.74 NODE_175_length_2567_cov_13.285941_g132_i0:206-2104(+)